MTAKDVARFLTEECTDEEFAEVFAYMGREMVTSGRQSVDSMVLDKDDMVNMDIRWLCTKVESVLEEIIHDPETDASAWWKQ